MKLYFITALSVLAVILGAYQYGRRTAEQAEKLKQQRETIKQLKEVRNVQERINTMSDNNVRDRLYDDWSRD